MTKAAQAGAAKSVRAEPVAPPRLVFPLHAPGMAIGLFGGTFDPPHRAHREACLLAMKRLRLDRVWWLVTPGNPLKDTRDLTPLAARIAAINAFVDHPRIDVTGVEAVMGTQYTHDTLREVIARCPGVRFVWIMGADNLRNFHRWQNWQGIAARLPMAVVDRPGASLAAMASPTAQALAPWRLRESEAALLSRCLPPAWVYLHGLKSDVSSTALRAKAGRR